MTAPGMSIEHSATEANYRTLSLGAQHIYRHTDLEQTEKDTTNDESITVVKQKVTDYKKTVDVRCVCVCVCVATCWAGIHFVQQIFCGLWYKDLVYIIET